MPLDVDEIVAALSAKRSGSGWVARCPAHDDKDPSLSINVKDGKLLVHCHAGCSFTEILSSVGIDPGVRSRYYRSDCCADYARNAEKIAELWAETIPIIECLPVQRYFDKRGVLIEAMSASPFKLKAHPRLEYWDTSGDKPVSLGRYPAIVALVESPAGDIVSLHRTYITKDGDKVPHKPVRKMMPGTGPRATKQARIELFKPANILGVGEGIETVLAARGLFRASRGIELPVWSCISASGLENCVVPKTVETVVVLSDNDKSRTGQKAAYKLKDKLEDFDVEVLMPAVEGEDFADILGRKNK